MVTPFSSHRLLHLLVDKLSLYSSTLNNGMRYFTNCANFQFTITFQFLINYCIMETKQKICRHFYNCKAVTFLQKSGKQPY